MQGLGLGISLRCLLWQEGLPVLSWGISGCTVLAGIATSRPIVVAIIDIVFAELLVLLLKTAVDIVVLNLATIDMSIT